MGMQLIELVAIAMLTAAMYAVPGDLQLKEIPPARSRRLRWRPPSRVSASPCSARSSAPSPAAISGRAAASDSSR